MQTVTSATAQAVQEHVSLPTKVTRPAQSPQGRLFVQASLSSQPILGPREADVPKTTVVQVCSGHICSNSFSTLLLGACICCRPEKEHLLLFCRTTMSTLRNTQLAKPAAQLSFQACSSQLSSASSLCYQRTVTHQQRSSLSWSTGLCHRWL